MNQLLYEEIVQKIEKQIYDGDYEDGDKLPSERELSGEHLVSRNVIREAIGALREKGLIVVKPGKGAYVTKNNNGMVTETLKRMLKSDDSTGEDILEVRESLEIVILRKAVHQASPGDIACLKSIYEKMDSCKHDVNAFVEEDASFHMTFAKATQNRIFPLLYDAFYEFTEGSVFALTRFAPYSVKDAQRHHQKLIIAVETGNEDLAITTIKQHIDLLRKEMTFLKDS